MKAHLIFVLTLIVTSGCQPEKAPELVDYPNQFGEIPFDALLDDSSFGLCDSMDLVHSRTSLSYVGGWARIEVISRDIFEATVDVPAFDGYVVARFLVNCDGKIGRLRLEAMDDGFMEKEAPEGLMSLVKKAVKALDEWIITNPANMGKDHSKYMNFKIKNGQVNAIIH